MSESTIGDAINGALLAVLMHETGRSGAPNQPIIPDPGDERYRELRSMKYDEYLVSDEWIRIAASVKTAALGVCQMCGEADTPLDVHHVTYERRGGRERASDLIALCHRCHFGIHRTIGDRRR